MATKIVTKNSSTASAVPTASDLVQGELAVNVADKRLFTEDNAGAIVELGTNPSGNVTFQDNGKAIFGAGSDLQIYHDGFHSIIAESGGGSLLIRGDNTYFTNSAATKGYADFIADGAVTLRYNNLAKLATTATGIDVTGTATMSGLVVNTGSYGAVGAGSGRMYGSSTHGLVIQGSGTTNDFLFLGSDGSDSFKIANNGDISFYEDTGTTAKLFWDASAESLTVGNSSGLTNTAGFSSTLGVKGSLPSITIEDTSTGTGKYTLGVTSGNFGLWDSTSSSYRMFVSSAGNVGIGESNPQELLHLTATTPVFRMQGGSRTYQQFVSGTSFTIRDVSAGLNRVTLDSAGNLLVGTTDAAVGVGNTNVGHSIGAAGYAAHSRSGNASLFLNRTTSDGAIANFSKDGTTVGSIGTIDGDFNIYASASGHKGLRFGNGFIAPTSNSITIEDATTDLGLSTHRFKDLYLSGTANVGSVSSTGNITANGVTIGSSDIRSSSNILTLGGTTERMRIDSAGNVGIGTASATSIPGFAKVVKLEDSSSASYVVSGGVDEAEFAISSSGGYLGTTTNVPMRFVTNSIERARIDASGNLLVGKTSLNIGLTGQELRANGSSYLTASSDTALGLNRLSSDGTVLEIRKDNAIVGRISSTATGGGSLVIGNASSGIMFRTDLTSSAFIPANPTTGAQVDNVLDVGHSAIRFDDIYATNGTIQTSDRNEKQDIAELSDAEQRVAVASKGLLRKFRWKDSVAEKGDEARTHFGIIAQDLQDAFAAEGLDAGDYAMFISSTWTDEETNEEKTRMGVRYSELLAFIIAAI